jgi:hypothetical protein
VDLARAAAWHRQVAALAAAADRAGLAGAHLPTILARLHVQQAALGQVAARTQTPLPSLIPTPAEIAAAGAGFGDLSEPAVDLAIRTANQALDAADAELGLPAPILQTAPPRGEPTPTPAGQAPPHPHVQGPQGPPMTPESTSRVALRNGLVYGGFSTTVLAIQIVLLFLGDEETTLPLLAPVCLIALPAFAWLGGWLTIGAAFREGPGRPVNRTPRLGAVVCLMPNALLCAALGVLFVAR